jgi:hypothetical protein
LAGGSLFFFFACQADARVVKRREKRVMRTTRCTRDKKKKKWKECDDDDFLTATFRVPLRGRRCSGDDDVVVNAERPFPGQGEQSRTEHVMWSLGVFSVPGIVGRNLASSDLMLSVEVEEAEAGCRFIADRRRWTVSNNGNKIDETIDKIKREESPVSDRLTNKKGLIKIAR